MNEGGEAVPPLRRDLEVNEGSLARGAFVETAEELGAGFEDISLSAAERGF